MRTDVCVVCSPEVHDAAKIPGEVAGRHVEGSWSGCGHGLRWCGDLASAGVVWPDVSEYLSSCPFPPVAAGGCSPITRPTAVRWLNGMRRSRIDVTGRG